MKPLLRYYGGKQRLAHVIVPLVACIPHTVYGEPFAGGAAILFAKPHRAVTNKDCYREVLNDRDERIVTLYRVAQAEADALYARLQQTPYSQAAYQRAGEILRCPDALPIDVAWAVLVQTHQAFGNKLGGGWATGTISRNHAATWARYQDIVPDMLARLREVFLSCEDALACIQRWDAPQTLLYCDPPYPGTEQGQYSGFTAEDWTALCQALDTAQCSYILSGYPQPVEPLSAQKRITVPAVMSVRNARHQPREARTEMLWICDRSADMRSDLARIAGLSAVRAQQMTMHDLFDST
jgi:DNA adenine methylase